MYMTIFQKIKLYKEYKQFLKKEEIVLKENFALDRNLLNELYVTLILTDVPEEVRLKYDIATVAEVEIKKYISGFNKYLEQNNITELVNVYEIKKIKDDLYGITFGFSLLNNRRYFLFKLSIFLLTVILITLKIII